MSEPPKFSPWWEVPLVLLIGLLIMFAPVWWSAAVVPVFNAVSGAFAAMC